MSEPKTDWGAPGHAESTPPQRCLRCRDPIRHCICATLEPLTLETRVELVLHCREVKKCATTGPFALTALSQSRLHLHGLRHQPLNLRDLHHEGRRVLVLFPGEDATVLSPDFIERDGRPITLVVPDGSFRQAGRAARRIPGLDEAELVKLEGPQASTFTALARALGLIEAPAVERELLRLFERSQARRKAIAGEMGDTEAVSTLEGGIADPVAPLVVLFEDESLIAVNKPAGMLVHRGWAKDAAPALQILRDQVGQHLFPVHRLDRATSGALLFAKNPEVARDMKALFDAQLVEKRYLAVCRGHQFERRRVTHPLSVEKGRPRSPAVTDLRLLGAFERYGLFEAIPRTGRTHQIRKHLKHVSHPIIGDVRYGKGEHNRIFRERFGFGRLALHCHQMSFVHPRGGDLIHIDAPLAGDFAMLLVKLDLASALG